MNDSLHNFAFGETRDEESGWGRRGAGVGGWGGGIKVDFFSLRDIQSILGMSAS